MKAKLFIFLLIFSSFANAKSVVSCQFDHNLDHIEDVRVETEPGAEKRLIFNNEYLTAYITEKSHSNFEVEAFLPEQQMRLYALGALSEYSHTLVLTSWSREMLVEISCRLFRP